MKIYVEQKFIKNLKNLFYLFSLERIKNVKIVLIHVIVSYQINQFDDVVEFNVVNVISYQEILLHLMNLMLLFQVLVSRPTHLLFD